jgi:biopolymer transport protein TolR
MGMTVGGGKGSMFEPNIVPLIDVLLVLIIIFMVITPTTPQGLRALVPQPAPDTPHAVQPPDTIVVQVSSDGKVRINQNDVSWDGLGPRLQDIFKRRADKAAFVKGDDSVEFVRVARAIDVVRSSGIEDVGLITAKIEAGQ